MCGIVGYTGNQEAAPIIMDGLRRLEYRGYDSAGIATFEKKGIEIIRATGKLNCLADKLSEYKLTGTTGIGHTRWATHGRPSEVNAHPHKADGIVVVHNGIVENYTELKNMLIKQGRKFSSETDTEVIAHLVSAHFKKTGEMKAAILKTVKELRGTFACAILNENEPGKIYLAKQESPLVLGLGKKSNFFASDMPALLIHTDSIVFLRDGDIVELTPGSYTVFDFSGKAVKRQPEKVKISISQAEKGGYPHFMLKEIFEQPEAFVNTVRTRIKPGKKEIIFDELPLKLIKKVKALHIIACGTSYHSGLLGRIFFEELAQLPVTVEIASEFRYKKNFFRKDALYVFISQSGATADTLAALKLCKQKGVKTLAVCNVLGSSISLEADYTIYTHAGPEIGVASTKAFTTQVAVMLVLALKWAQELKTLDEKTCAKYMTGLLKVSTSMKKALKGADAIKNIAKKYYRFRNFLYLGRGANFPLSMEGALKLKEISYIHAEAYAAGEMKHGPIALIDEHMPVFIINPDSRHHEKTRSNLQEVLARGGKVICLVSEKDTDAAKFTDDIIRIPRLNDYMDALVSIIPLQLFAYYCAVFNGTDVDQPRNLAKSVTVE